MVRAPYGNAIMDRVTDADFNNLMSSVNFSAVPREVVTIRDMENYHKQVYFKNLSDSFVPKNS